MARITIDVPMNRVEGDLEVRADLEDGVVADARCTGTMFRGFERLLVGRGALDGLVLTPRICGLCSTSHLTAAARALDAVTGVAPPADGTRIRNVVLMAEHLQSDVRQAFLMFAADFPSPRHASCELHEEAVRRYQPLRGESVAQAVRETKHLLEIISILGGQWPHTSFMVPGGITSLPAPADLLQCRLILKNYRLWYEKRILGCPMERMREVRRAEDLDAWLAESAMHSESDLGFFIRFCRAVGIDKMGKGHGNFLSYGSLDLPEGTAVRAPAGGGRLVAPGFAKAGVLAAFDQANVAEHVAYSWFVDYDGGKHPFEGETEPLASGAEADKYSWAKAPRYDGSPAEVGPLAEAVLARHPLFTDLVQKQGPTAFVRELARILRAVDLVPPMETWLAEVSGASRYYNPTPEPVHGEGFGLTEAGRGALGHWVRVDDGKISHYQVITPTAWNASPRDSDGVRGPMEEALVGTPVSDPSNPVELGHVVRSFDPCLVCTVHVLDRGRERGRVRVGGVAS